MSGALHELAVRGLGIIDDLRLVLDPGMTAVTGETGAGKTLVVEAIELLVGGRADPALVKPGAGEAVVEGRFDLDGDEVVLSRVIPESGRSRAYVNGRLATVAALAEVGERLVDLHGQHAHQSLLGAAMQRHALDQFAGTDLGPLEAARAELATITHELGSLGGDERSRAREIDLLRFQVEEIDGVAPTGPDEDEVLDAEEDQLTDALAHREAAELASAALATDDGGAADRLATALASIRGRAPFAAESERLQGLLADASDVASELRAAAERIVDDPERLATVRERRQALRDLRRKYGDTLAEVAECRTEIGTRLDELVHWEDRAAQLESDRAAAAERVADVAADVARVRRAAAPGLGAAVQARLAELEMAQAQLEVRVEGEGPADDVTLLLAANPGAPLLPLRKVASGGELARAMLALRLVLTVGPPVLVFDEVDAGIGGHAARAVGQALARLGQDHQVLVVTHLPQVAAWADHHVRVAKDQGTATTVSTAVMLDDESRIVELSRMLSGDSESPVAREHARELLAASAMGEGTR